MISRSVIIQELREMIKNGAPPSRLLRHIISRNPGEELNHWVLREYLEEAFGLPSARLLQSDTDYTNPDLRYAVLNRTLIPEIIQRRKAWDSCQSISEQCWLDNLAATNPEQAEEEAQRIPYGGLSQTGWDSLSRDEQEIVHLQLAGSRILSERVAILATLAERLQQQVEILKKQLADQHARSQESGVRSQKKGHWFY